MRPSRWGCASSQAVEKRPAAAFPSSFAVQRTQKYASRLRSSGALHPDVFEQPTVSAIFQKVHRGCMALHDEDTGRGANLEAVLAELKRGKAVPCYLLYGEEEFRLKDALDRIIAALIPDANDRDLNLFVT